ncbi:DUF484 family protein [Dongshaea marina]|uniref:DUF484 family protein n=1 Tax=Dongshaea marina TaxID=2047966 RepID=UPI000D3E376E|nr:DUF484 family protein [Dongshaea marina]
MSEEAIVHYLSENPDFFLRHPQLLGSLKLDHPERGVISLTELQLGKLRERIAEQQEEITGLLTAASYNEQLFRIYADLYVELHDCKTLADLQELIEQSFLKQRHISAFRLLLNPAVHPQEFDSNHHIDLRAFKKLQMHRLGGEGCYFGRISQAEKQQLFGDYALVNSVALVAIGEHAQLGILAFSSADASHYTPGMDPMLLELLCRMIAVILPEMISHCEQD